MSKRAASTGEPSSTSTSSNPVPETITLLGVGDIADCKSSHDSETAALAARLPVLKQTLLTLSNVRVRNVALLGCIKY